MKNIILMIVCSAVMSESHPVGVGRPGDNFGDLESDIGTGLDIDDLEYDIVSSAEANAEAMARDLVSDNADGTLANFGIGMYRPESQAAASNYERGTSFDANQYNTGAGGADRKDFLKRGEQNYHDRGHHHSTITKVEHSESSDEHDIGSSQAFDEGAQELSGFNKYGNSARRSGNSYEDSQQEESAL